MDINKWLVQHDADVVGVTVADIVAGLRKAAVRHANTDGALISSVADWIETPPEWINASWKLGD